MKFKIGDKVTPTSNEGGSEGILGKPYYIVTNDGIDMWCLGDTYPGERLLCHWYVDYQLEHWKQIYLGGE